MITKIKNMLFYNLKELVTSISGKIKLDIYVKAVTIIIIGVIRPALTADSPKTRAPSIDIAEPYFVGNLKSLSLKISKENIIAAASTKAGKGTPSLWVENEINKSVGILSWSNVISER